MTAPGAEPLSFEEFVRRDLKRAFLERLEADYPWLFDFEDRVEKVGIEAIIGDDGAWVDE